MSSMGRVHALHTITASLVVALSCRRLVSHLYACGHYKCAKAADILLIVKHIVW